MNTRPRLKQSERGLTLIELMIALLISSLLIGMVFAIYVRMSVAYRAQTGISEVQQTLRSAKAQVVRDAQMAGHLIPSGFRASAAVMTNLGVITPEVPPVAVFNNIDDGSTDRLRVFYADPSAIARITGGTPPTSVTVDDVDKFQPDDVVVIVATRTPVNNPNTNLTDPGQLARYDACALQITAVDAATNTITFGVSAPYNDGTETHCEFVPPFTTPPPPPAVSIIATDNMIYRLKARTYRIDPTRRDLSVLQMSPTGEMEASDFQDIGLGFTDFQLAYRAYEGTVSDGDLDGDGDVLRDWHSGAVPKPDDAVITEVTISLTVRSTRDLNVVTSARTPGFIDLTNIDHNQLGDSPSVDLPDSLDRPQYRGNHIYRYASVRVDLRNTGVGR